MRDNTISGEVREYVACCFEVISRSTTIANDIESIEVAAKEAMELMCSESSENECKKDTIKKKGHRRYLAVTMSSKNAVRILHSFASIIWSECDGTTDTTNNKISSIEWKIASMKKCLDLSLQQSSDNTMIKDSPQSIDGIALLGITCGTLCKLLLLNKATINDFIECETIVKMLNICYDDDENTRINGLMNSSMCGSINGIRSTCEKMILQYIG